MSKMEVTDYVAKKLDVIKILKHDPELGHPEEKRLWETVLRLAGDGYDVQDAANGALKSNEIDFPRWFA